MVQKSENLSFKIPLAGKINSEHSQHSAQGKADEKEDRWTGQLEGEQTNSGVHFKSFLVATFTFWEKHFCLTYLKRGFVRKSKFQGTNEQPPIIRFVLIPCRSAPAKRKKRPVCCVLLLYLFGCAVIIPDCTCA